MGVDVRIRTGILGLDELLQGGFPTGGCVLVSGRMGTGKSIFATQYIARGIMGYGEMGVLVSFERDKKELYQDALGFGWPLQNFEKEGSLEVLGGSMARVAGEMSKAKATVEDLISEMVETAENFRSKRLALDGVEFLEMLSQDKLEFMLQLSDLKDSLRELGCTFVLTSEVREGQEELSRVGAEGLADGIIVLYYEGEGLTRDRALEIRKMKGTEHSNQLHFFDITNRGITIKGMPERPKVPRGGWGSRTSSGKAK
jgi:KaiC/GvpD/RAD55 family RecA-like ATPase